MPPLTGEECCLPLLERNAAIPYWDEIVPPLTGEEWCHPLLERNGAAPYWKGMVLPLTGMVSPLTVTLALMGLVLMAVRWYIVPKSNPQLGQKLLIEV